MPASFFSIKNLRSDIAEKIEGRPWDAAIPARPGLSPTATKEEYRAWCADPALDWCFLSMVEGLTPTQRVSAVNPCKFLHGIIADYDAKLSDRAAVLQIIADNSPPGLGPTAISTTFSGNVRLVWEFEEPLLLDHTALFEAFMERASKETRMSKILPHFDTSSLEYKQYFEIGTDWALIPGSQPLKQTTVQHWLAESALKAKKLSGDGPVIPYERIAAEIEKQFPGRIAGEIKEGTRVPLFWLADGIDRIGAVLGEHGVICFSDRAGKSFLTWSEVLGSKFVREFEEERTGAACNEFWYDGKKYWSKDNGVWCYTGTDDMSRRLKVCYSLSGQVGRKDTASEVDKALVAIQQTRRVQCVAPFIYNPQEIVHFNGLKYLNISSRRMMEPAPDEQEGDFPWLREYFDNIWGPAADEHGNTQREYFFAWLKRFWESGRAGRLLSGQILFIAGDHGQGKTFLSQFIMAQIAGGFGDATRVLLGQESFNRELGEVAMWSVDDGNATVDYQSRVTFSENIKAAIANPTIKYHPKYLDSSTLPWQGRIMVTCNTDPQSLQIIPTTENTIVDKLMLFKLGDWKPTWPPNPVIEAKVRAELPFFLRWLAKWTPPAGVMSNSRTGNRYGVRSFLHPDILAHSQELAAHTHFLDELDTLRWDDAFIEPKKGVPPEETYWEGTAGDLARAGREHWVVRGTPLQIGVWLAKIHKEGSAKEWLFRKEGRSRKVYWRITRQGDRGDE